MVAHGSSELAKCEASANAAHQRLMEYVNQTKATNEQHLNEAKEAITTIQQKIKEFSDTHNDTFSPATSLVQSLPMQHRIQLNLLAIKYIAADRASVHSMGNVSAILDRISASIVAQQQVVDTAYEQDTQQAQQELSAELARCAGVQTATVAGSTSREDDLRQKKETSDAKLLADVVTEADARSQKVSDCAAAAAAQSMLESETIKLTAQRTSCFNAADSTYSGCSSAASTSLNECTDYLAGETNIISRILDAVLAANQHHAKLRSSRITQANANTSTPQIVPAVPNKSPIPSSPASQLAKQLRDAHINSPGGQSDQTRQHTHSVPSIANLRSATHVDQPTPMEIDDVEATNQLRQQGSAIIVPTDNPTKPVPKRKAGSNHGHVGKSKKARQDVAILSNN